MRQINLFIILMIGIMLTACQPSTPPATSVTSNDTVGGISLSFPGDWTVFAEKSPVEGRQNVTLVRFPEGEEQLNIDQFPVIRVSYESRAATSLAFGTPLETVALRQAETLAPRAIFGETTVTQVDIYPAVLLKGENSGADRQYYFVFVDFASEGGLVTLVLTAPDDVSAYESVIRSIAPTIRLTIKPEFMVPTPTIAPEETAFIFPEQTGLFGPPESTAEVAPESTAPVESTSEVAPEATGEIATTEEAAATEEIGTDEAAAGTREVIATEEVGAASTPELIAVDPEATIMLSSTPVTTPETVVMDASGVATLPAPQTPVATPTLDTAAQEITLANGFTLVTLEGWAAKLVGTNQVKTFLEPELEDGFNLATTAIPTGRAEILITVGTIRDILGTAVDVNKPLESLIGSNNTYIMDYGEINEFEIKGQPASSLLATSPNFDWYIVLIEHGGGITSGLLLYTASGEAEAFIPQVLEIAESLSPAQQ